MLCIPQRLNCSSKKNLIQFWCYFYKGTSVFFTNISLLLNIEIFVSDTLYKSPTLRRIFIISSPVFCLNSVFNISTNACACCKYLSFPPIRGSNWQKIDIPRVTGEEEKFNSALLGTGSYRVARKNRSWNWNLIRGCMKHLSRCTRNLFPNFGSE